MRKDNIIKVLMDRDGMTHDEAVNKFGEVMDEVRSLVAVGKFDEAEDRFLDMLGLELDYMM